MRPWAKWLLAMLVSPCVLPTAAAARDAATNYVLRCAGCHGLGGAGVTAGGIPDFRNSVGAFAADEEGRSYLLKVPGVVGAGLSDREIADVLNYVLRSWGGSSARSSYVPFTPKEVAARRAHSVADVVQLRRQIVKRLDAAGIATAAYPWP